MKRSGWMTVLMTGSVLTGVLAGCSENDRTGSVERRSPFAPGVAANRAGPMQQNDPGPPAGLVPVTFGGSRLSLWPYTGESLDGTPSDPVNLIFAGNTDPVRIRAALMNLDGDRTAFGFPPAPPFNATWSDAVGGVHTNYAEGEGWQGSVIQLQLGTYAPIRVHLRLFRTTAPFGSSGTWTVGAAHFEVLIPGTADHQVLSWELAEQVVMADMIRSGLLDPASMPPQQTDAITQAPSFRTIPAAIYNGLPEELKAATGLPPGPASSDVPIPNDGRATILHVTGEPSPRVGSSADRFTLNYGQIIPKPFCSDGPLDWILVSGPVELTRSTDVDASGRYQYRERLAGRLTVTPVDVTQSPPAPSGPSREVEVGDLQEGWIHAAGSLALAQAKRIAPKPEGAELSNTFLRVASKGLDSYRAETHCP
jgi:hypothetical protein